MHTHTHTYNWKESRRTFGKVERVAVREANMLRVGQVVVAAKEQEAQAPLVQVEDLVDRSGRAGVRHVNVDERPIAV